MKKFSIRRSKESGALLKKTDIISEKVEGLLTDSNNSHTPCKSEINRTIDNFSPDDVVKPCTSPDSVLFHPVARQPEDCVVPTTLSTQKTQEVSPRIQSMTTMHTKLQRKQLSFADEKGQPLQSIRIIEPSPTRRAILLLLSPQDRKFEFLHIEYPLDDNTTIQVIMDQMPKLAKQPIFRRFAFSSLAFTSKQETLDADRIIGECELRDNELLLGIPMGYTVNQIGGFAVPLLLNGDIIKAVKLAKRSGKGLKTVKSGNDWKRRGKPKRIPKSSTRNRVQPMIKTESELPIESSRVIDAKNIDGDVSHCISQPLEDPLEDSFSNCKAELNRLASLQAPPLPAVRSRSITSKETSREITSLESNAKHVVNEMVAEGFLSEGHATSKHTEDVTEIPPSVLRDDDDDDDDDAEFEERYNFDNLPDMEGDKDTEVPDLMQNILGVGADRAMFLIHAVSIAAVGYFTNNFMG